MIAGLLEGTQQPREQVDRSPVQHSRQKCCLGSACWKLRCIVAQFSIWMRLLVLHMQICSRIYSISQAKCWTAECVCLIRIHRVRTSVSYLPLLAKDIFVYPSFKWKWLLYVLQQWCCPVETYLMVLPASANALSCPSLRTYFPPLPLLYPHLFLWPSWASSLDHWVYTVFSGTSKNTEPFPASHCVHDKDKIPTR